VSQPHEIGLRGTGIGLASNNLSVVAKKKNEFLRIQISPEGSLFVGVSGHHAVKG
jgi:hypothetical protein